MISLPFLLAAGLVPTTASAQALPTISRPSGAAVPAGPRVGIPFSSATQNGQECTTLTFEGLGNNVAVPPISGITFTGWLSLIDSDAGGDGNFANEPSPETIMFWLGANPSITFGTPASKVEFYYSTATTLTVTAFDADNVQIAQISRPPNHDSGPGGDPTGEYNNWTLLAVQVSGKKIARLNVAGGPNYTGFDNLNVCRSVAVDSVELTQAIQQWQPLDELKADLASVGEPPVPIVAGKPAALRVYMEKVDTVTQATLEVSGAVSGTRAVTLQPHCTVEKQRLGQEGCASADFYFTPPEGNFNVTLRVRPAGPGGTVTETHELPFRGRTTNVLRLKAVTVCDEKNVIGAWLCGNAFALPGLTQVLQKIAPTHRVEVQVTSHAVLKEVEEFGHVNDWWDAAVAEISDLHGIFDWGAGVLGTTVKYYGMLRPELLGLKGGMVHEIGGHGGASRTSVPRFDTIETNDEVVAHETGHLLGLRHTNVGVPMPGDAPGCYNLAVDPASDWPFANNRIQSAARLEVGFDVLARRPLDPQNTFDIMSYCVPRWISPLRYKRMITALSGGAVTTPSMTSAPAVVGAAWLVSGTIVDGAVQFNPLFAIQAELEPGTGSHAVNVLAGNGSVLATSGFTPAAPTDETAEARHEGPPRFTVVVPQAAGAASLVVRSDTNDVLGTITLGGTAPTVQMLTPLPPGVLAGQMLLAWSITDPDSASHTTRVQYSADAGASWADLGVVPTNEMLVDVDRLPGGGVTGFRLLVSDGVNTTTTTVGPFQTAKKTNVAAAILSPATGVVVAPGVLFLEGTGFDVDDGTLGGSALTWTSSVAGALGTGARISANLPPGAHVIQLTATDSDGNTGTAQTTVQVAGPPPAVSLTLEALNELPTTCMAATIGVSSTGVPPAVVEYSLNAGATWTSVPAGSLPFSFVVPGSGFFNLVARAIDAAGQSSAAGETFFTSAPCDQPVLVVTPTSWDAPVGESTQAVAILSSDAGLAWTATTNQPWLTVSPASGVGTGSVTLTAAANAGGTRTATATIAGQTVTVTQAGLTVTDLRVTRVAGNQVTLRWAWNGPPTAGFVVAGGVQPGQTLATVPTGGGNTVFTFTAPTGTFHVRVHTVEDTAFERPSNEVPLVVNRPVAPSAPANLLATVTGNRLDLAWTNTFTGGPPTGVRLQVSGAVNTAFALGPTDRFSFIGVPPGTYTLAVVATNPGGVSTPSNPVTLTFPTACTGAPLPPTQFLAYRVGRTVFVVWEPPATGPAPTDYILGVPELGLNLRTGGARTLSGTVPPGTYTLSVVATNACGTSGATATQVVTVP